MINRITAIALNSIRLAIRSRLVVSLIVFLMITIIGLPLSIKGDGTFAGKATILLFYTLGLTVIILSASTMWSSCSSISQEVAGKQIQLVSVKPVSAFQIWLGKWIGILIMNAVLLILAGSTIYAFLMLDVENAGLDEEETKALYNEVLVGRRVVAPREEHIHDQVHNRIQQLVSAGKIPPELKNDEALFLEMEKRMKASRYVVGPGQTRQWVFDLPKSFKEKEVVAIRYKFSSGIRDQKPIKATWQVGTLDTPNNYTETVTVDLEGTQILYIPADSIKPGAPAIVSFSNIEVDRKTSIVFDQTNGIELMNKASSFTANYARSIMVIFVHLSLIAALGLTIGSLLSFPVATFITCSIIIISLSVHYFTVLAGDDTHIVCHSHDHNHPAPSRMNELTTAFVKGAEKYISPSMHYKPLDKLADGILVSWPFTLGAALLLGLAYPAILAILGTLFLKSRELALPGRHT